MINEVDHYHEYTRLVSKVSALTACVHQFKHLYNFPKAYEVDYQESNRKENLFRTWVSLVIGIILFVGSGIFDLTMLRDTKSIVIRLYIITPLLLFILLCSFSKYFYRLQQILVAAFAILATFGLVAVAAVIPFYMKNILYMSLLLIALFVTTIAKLSFHYTILVMIAVLLIFNIGFLLNTNIPPEIYTWDLLGTNYILIGGLLLCAISSYVYEVNRRKQYLMMELINAKNELSTFLSHYDPVTGVANRRFFDDWVEIAWSEALKKEYFVSILFIDFDYFKEYNDTYGHKAGDKALNVVAGAITQLLMNYEGLICRYGGDEFIIVLLKLSPQQTTEIATTIMKKIEQLHLPHKKSKDIGYVSITMGICSEMPTNNNSVGEIIENADIALRFGKRQKRDRVYLYHTNEILEVQ